MKRLNLSYRIVPVTWRLALGCAFAGAGQLQAEVTLFSSSDESETTFLQAIAAEQLTILGRESFPSVGASVMGSTPGAILAPGIPAGNLFPSGSNSTLGLLFQSNILGNNPTAPAPGSTLFAVGPTAESNRTWLGPTLATNSFDIFIDPPDYRGRARALSFALSTNAGAPVVVRVYDNANMLLASETFATANLDRIGIVSSSQHLFRVNLYAPGGYVDVAALDLYVTGATSGVPTGLADLIAAYFPGADPESFDLATDHNGSGISTIAELAFGNHPAIRAVSRFGPELVSGPDPVVVTHPLDRSIVDLIGVEVAWSVDLAQWNLAQPGVNGVTRVVEPEAYRAAAGGLSAVDRIRFTIPTTAGSAAFVRFNVRLLGGE